MNVIGLRPDRGPIVTRGGAIALRAEGPARVERHPFPIVSYTADGRPGKVLAHVPGTEIEVATISAGPLAGGFQRGLRLFGADAALGLSNGHVIAVDNAHFQFDVIDTSGRLIRRVRRAHVPETVRPAHIAAYVEERVSAVRSEARASLRARLDGTSHAAVFPALEARVVVGADERIWLGGYKRPGDREQAWWIFTVDGQMAGRVVVPAALTVVDAGTDFVLGVWRDEDGVQTVRLYRLAPAAGGRGDS